VISSQLDLYDESTDFLIEDSNPAFGATGIRKTSYVTSTFVVDLDQSKLGRRMGTLSGDLLRSFEAWWRRRI
jgi:hypothetical protein